MTITISDIATTVSRYLDTYPAEKAGLEPLLLALGTGVDSILSRAGLPGHVTCSAAVLDGRGGVLMVRHRALDMWLIPGGHIEPGDDSLLSAALRELDEETGVSWEDIAELPDADAIPVDIDVHPIPANPAKSEQEHWHADFRYVIKAPRPDTITIQAEEVSSYNWLLPSLLHHRRLAAKIAQSPRPDTRSPNLRSECWISRSGDLLGQLVCSVLRARPRRRYRRQVRGPWQETNATRTSSPRRRHSGRITIS